jgi:hypothetical protein
MLAPVGTKGNGMNPNILAAWMAEVILTSDLAQVVGAVGIFRRPDA